MAGKQLQGVGRGGMWIEPGGDFVSICWYKRDGINLGVL